MSKTLETKKKILELLENRKMTITELSKELRLSKATISQHVDELTRINAVEKIDSEYYKKLKYYKTTPNHSAMLSRAIGVIIIIGIIAYAIIFYSANTAHQNGPSAYNKTTLTTAQVTTAAYFNASSNVIATPGSLSTFVSCIFLSYGINGRIENASGFSAYTINYTVGNATRNVTDYVIGRNSSGRFLLTENITNVLKEPSNYNSTRSHYYMVRYNSSISGVYPGVKITFNPKTFYAANSTINVTAYVKIAANATYGTYWINLDGPCGGGIGPELLTIGSKPYDGTIKSPVNIFG